MLRSWMATPCVWFAYAIHMQKQTWKSAWMMTADSAYTERLTCMMTGTFPTIGSQGNVQTRGLLSAMVNQGRP